MKSLKVMNFLMILNCTVYTIFPFRPDAFNAARFLRSQQAPQQVSLMQQSSGSFLKDLAVARCNSNIRYLQMYRSEFPHPGIQQEIIQHENARTTITEASEEIFSDESSPKRDSVIN